MQIKPSFVKRARDIVPERILADVIQECARPLDRRRRLVLIDRNSLFYVSRDVHNLHRFRNANDRACYQPMDEAFNKQDCRMPMSIRGEFGVRNCKRLLSFDVSVAMTAPVWGEVQLSTAGAPNGGRRPVSSSSKMPPKTLPGLTLDIDNYQYQRASRRGIMAHGKPFHWKAAELLSSDR